jgi:hypothetical protein
MSTNTKNTTESTIKIKRGTVREDGLVFFSGYKGPNGKRYEYWVTPEEFLIRKQNANARSREYQRRTYTNPSRRAVLKARAKANYYRKKSQVLNTPVYEEIHPFKDILMPAALLIVTAVIVLYVVLSGHLNSTAKTDAAPAAELIRI